MKLKSIHVWRNDYDFNNNGVEAKSYGGTADFEVAGGVLTITLDAVAVQGMVEFISPQVVNSCKAVGDTKITDVIRSASSNLLKHEAADAFR